MIIFDTDTLTHFSYGNDNIRKKIQSVGDGEKIAVTLITHIELFRARAENILKAANRSELKKAVERFRKSEEMLDDFLILPLDDKSISYFERFRKVKKLKKIGRADLLIACISCANQALLVSRNTKDFGLVSGLRLENWVD